MNILKIKKENPDDLLQYYYKQYKLYDKLCETYDLCDEDWDSDILINLEPEIDELESELKCLEDKLDAMGVVLLKRR